MVESEIEAILSRLVRVDSLRLLLHGGRAAGAYQYHVMIGETKWISTNFYEGHSTGWMNRN